MRARRSPDPTTAAREHRAQLRFIESSFELFAERLQQRGSSAGLDRKLDRGSRASDRVIASFFEDSLEDLDTFASREK